MRQRVDRSSWSRTKLTLPAWLLVLGLAGAGSAFGQQAAESGGPPGADTVEGLQERAIRETYRAHEEAIYRSGTYIEIELSDFRTVLPAEYAQVRTSELVALPGPYRIQIRPFEVEDSDGLVGRSFGAVLEHLKDWVEPSYVLSLTLAELLEIAREDSRGTAPEPLAVTSFRVTTKIESETLRYRAIARWIRLPAGDDPGEFWIGDEVMDIVPAILTNTDPVFSTHELYRQLGARQERRLARFEEQAQVPEASGVDAVDADTVEAALREVYARHAHQVTASGTPLEVEISNVRVIPAGELGELRIRDVISSDPSSRVLISQSSHSVHGEEVGVSFPARWSTAHTPDEETLKVLFDLTFGEMLDYLRRAGTEVLTPAAIMAFDSRVTLAGRSVAYKAYLELPEDRTALSSLVLRIHDPVLQLVEEILAAERTARPEAEVREMVRERMQETPR